MAKVYLTGAGPGDKELLTLKAYKLIQKADVIIYDNLVNKEILEEAKEGVELIYVGKVKDNHTLPQEQINELIYKCSLKYECVVRLKGGDPFVFGRGGEEALYLKQRGVSFEIVPGITSAVCVPAYAGIPVTHRSVCSSFKVVTGHKKVNESMHDINWNSFKDDETLVFLMGLHNIELITSKLLEIGKKKTLSCAIISNGTTKKQKTIVGTLENIVEKSKEAITPAVFIVGEVVNLRKEIKWFEN
ncbi:uroporphyrinogen-III C-methyltransferase [Malaciobacter sp. WC5094]